MRRHNSVKTFRLRAASRVPNSSRSYCGREAPALPRPAGSCSRLHIRLGGGGIPGGQSDALGVCTQTTQDDNANGCLDQTRRYFCMPDFTTEAEILPGSENSG